MPADDLLVEIGTEELPPKSLNVLRTRFEAEFRAALSDNGFPCEDIKSFATPRRLALLVTGVADRQEDQHIERRGPAVKAAYDEDGNPTRALLGFAKSCGLDDPATLERLATDKGEWVVFRSVASGKSLSDLLESLIHESLAKLPIARRMRWGKNRGEFVRPVKWVLVLLGGNVVPVTILGVKADRISAGHRFMSPGAFAINNANDYVKGCREHCVIVDFDERADLIRSLISAEAEKLNADLPVDEALLDEVTALVEWPVVLAGSFDETFLEVPPEVLISAMKEHQRYFHLTDRQSGHLVAKFITVANIDSTDSSVVIGGNERVIRPRLSDAAFFYSQDTKTTLSDKLGRLDGVVFQSELGSYRDKAERIADLAAYIAEEIGLDASAAKRAALLSKADLVSDMVGEFPDLQGIMGGYYAAADGETADIASAISEHYRPIQSGGVLPSSDLGSCVALADKLDTLAGIFGINQQPSGSRDPFALRRQSLGVIRICIENGISVDLRACLEKAAVLYGKDFDITDVHDYILERLANWYGERGIQGDIVTAVRYGAHGANNLIEAHAVTTTLDAFRKKTVAEQIIAANKRVVNLLKQAGEGKPSKIKKTLLKDDAEKALADHLGQTRDQLKSVSSVSNQLEALAKLQPTVDKFFDDVLVMTDDDDLRQNRLAILSEVRELFLEVADFSLLQ